MKNRKHFTLAITALCLVVVIASMSLAGYFHIKNSMPNEEDVAKIKVGMTYDEVCKVLKSPGKHVGSGAFICQYEIWNAEPLLVWFGQTGWDSEWSVESMRRERWGKTP